MKKRRTQNGASTNAVFKLLRRHKQLGIGIAALFLLYFTGLAFPPRSFDRFLPVPFRRSPLSVIAPPAQLPLQAHALDHTRLIIQPLADRLRRRLGQRFDLPGREISAMTGTLTVGSSQHQVTVMRTQDDSGERVYIALDELPANLTWDSTGGALSGGNPATGGDRSLIERLALDSPDQFIMAQLRAASYYTVAQSARPSSAGGDETYSGPVWDIVRVGEPTRGNVRLPLSTFRLYHINVGTGLLDKVISVEQGQTIEAQISSWVNQGAEMVPTHISWKQGSQVIMDLKVTGVSFGPIQ